MGNDDHKQGITRRQAITAAVGGAALVTAGIASSTGPERAEASVHTHSNRSDGSRQPTLYLPHGGGPWPFVDVGFGDPRENEALASWLRSVANITPARPRALLVVSAHWEEPVPTVMTGTNPPLFFDYYGFPPESYRLTWPAPGSPTVAARVQELLRVGGFASATNAERGFDHGTFVPLKLTYPNADIPTVQLSLKRGLDPAEHLAIGRALAPLRDEGVFIVGSGMSYHNMRGFMGGGRSVSQTFDAWLQTAATAEPASRDQQLTQWASAPAARAAHPREEHLLPLMVIAGAAGSDRGRSAYSASYAGVQISAFQYG